MDDFLSAGGGILGIAGLAGLAWAVFRVKGTGATIDLLRQSVEIERSERIALDERCKRDTAVLEGRLAILTSEFAQVIAAAVMEAVRSERPGPRRQ